MSDNQSKIAILKEALAKISQDKKDIQLTKEDIENAGEKFMEYTNLNVKSDEIKRDIANLTVGCPY